MSAAGDRDSTGVAYVPALNDYDMYINDSQGAVDTSEMNEPGDVPNEEIRKVMMLHQKYKDPMMDRSYSPFSWHDLEDGKKFFASTEDIHTLRIWHDWAVAKRAYLLACTGVVSILVMMVEQELVFDHKTHLYRVMERTPSALKGAVTLITFVMLWQLYGLYDYMHAGLKKEWYVALYTNSEDSGKPLPRGILGTDELSTSFVLEFLFIAYHVPPGNEGVKKPFVSDKWNMCIFLRLYLWIRVLRDSCMIYRRRWQIYEGGYRRRGGPDITWSTALRHCYVSNKPVFALQMIFYSCIIFSYITYNGERDFQNDTFTIKNTIWFTIMQQLLVGYNDMFPKSAFGQTVVLANTICGMVILSLAIEIIFEALPPGP